MAKYEVRIKTKFGEFAIPFEDKEELRTKLKDAEELVKIIESEAGKFAAFEEKPVVGLEDIMTRTPDGLIRLLKVPDSAPKTVGVAVYSYYPKGGTIEQIEKSSCVKGFRGEYFKHKTYKNYFIELSPGVYSLTPEGLKWVTEIVDKLRSQKEVEEAQKEEVQKE